jgi:hypothetical protein
MHKLIEEICINFKKATRKDTKISSVPATPGNCLRKHYGQPVKLDEYISLVGKIM